MTPLTFDDYPDTSAAIWREQIIRDLKGKSLQEMYWSPDGVMTIDPYIHAEDITQPLPPLPDFGKWQIGEVFDITDPGKDNAHLLEALFGGVESLVLRCVEPVNWEILLDAVDLRLVHLGVEIQNAPKEGLQTLLNYAGDRYALEDLHISDLSDAPAVQGISRKSGMPSQAARSVAQALAAYFHRLITQATDPALWDLSLRIGNHYLVEISRLRACRLLWNNISEALGFHLSPAFTIEAYTAVDQGDDPYGHMVRSAFMATAAVLGGAGRVYVAPASGAGKAGFHRHIARNVSHLLRYESRFTEIPDPLAGAYYIDHLTKQIVDETWELLKLRFNE